MPDARSIIGRILDVIADAQSVPSLQVEMRGSRLTLTADLNARPERARGSDRADGTGRHVNGSDVSADAVMAVLDRASGAMNLQKLAKRLGVRKKFTLRPVIEQLLREGRIERASGGKLRPAGVPVRRGRPPQRGRKPNSTPVAQPPPVASAKPAAIKPAKMAAPIKKPVKVAKPAVKKSARSVPFQKKPAQKGAAKKKPAVVKKPAPPKVASSPVITEDAPPAEAAPVAETAGDRPVPAEDAA